MRLSPQIYGVIYNKTWLIVLAAFGLLACLMIPLYFYARRPRRGTIEWIGRLDPVSLRQPGRHRFAGADIAWALLSALCASFLRMAFYLFIMDVSGQENAMAAVKALIKSSFLLVAANGAFAAAIYLLLRAMFGNVLPAICIAVLSGLLLTNEVLGSALLAVSVLLLYLWVTADCTAPLFPRGLLLLFSAGFYALALFPASQMIWLSPFYLAVYVAVQIVRWRKGDLQRRKKTLLLSLGLTTLATVLGTLAVWVLYAFLRGWLSYSGLGLLLSGAFYRYFFSFLRSYLAEFFGGCFPLWKLTTSNLLLLILGGIGTVSLLHGLFRLRDSRCLFLLGMLVFSLCGMLLAGSFYLALPLLLILGWTWSTYAKRGYPSYVLLFVGMTGLIEIVDILIH